MRGPRNSTTRSAGTRGSLLSLASILLCTATAAQHAPPRVGSSPPEHWAWAPLDADLAHADLEALLERARRRLGAQRGPAADRATLVRRAHLVLTGLTPSPEAVAAHFEACSPGIGRLAAMIAVETTGIVVTDA